MSIAERILEAIYVPVGAVLDLISPLYVLNHH